MGEASSGALGGAFPAVADCGRPRVVSTLPSYVGTAFDDPSSRSSAPASRACRTDLDALRALVPPQVRPLLGDQAWEWLAGRLRVAGPHKFDKDELAEAATFRVWST